MVQPTDNPGAIWVADQQGMAAEDLDAAMDGLIAEFSDQLPDTVIVDHVLLACQQLSAGGVLAGLGPASASLARARLRAAVARGGTE